MKGNAAELQVMGMLRHCCRASERTERLAHVRSSGPKGRAFLQGIVDKGLHTSSIQQS